MCSIMCAVNEIGVLESSRYIWLMLPPKQNTLQYEYAYFHMLRGENAISPSFYLQQKVLKKFK